MKIHFSHSILKKQEMKLRQGTESVCFLRSDRKLNDFSFPFSANPLGILLANLISPLIVQTSAQMPSLVSSTENKRHVFILMILIKPLKVQCVK